MCKNTNTSKDIMTTSPLVAASPPPPPAGSNNNRKRLSSASGTLLLLGGESTWTEIRLFLELAIPTTLVSAGNNIGPLLIASYVGRRFGVTHLSGYTLANLSMNLCTFSLSSGLFSASDTLGPQAFGIGNYREVGLIAIRGFVVAHALLLPINVALYFYLQPLLLLLGQDAEAALYASQWYKWFVFSLPFAILYNCIWKFLSAQHIMNPPTAISLLSCCVILPVGLEILTKEFGFIGSAYAYVVFQALQALLLLGYLFWKRPHVPETWPSSTCASSLWKDALLQTDAVWEFVHLGLGGIFAQSEWLFWEALGLLVGLLGVLPLSVHTIPNQATSFCCFGAFACGVALAIRMGVTLPQSVKRAKQLAVMCVTVITLGDALLQLVIYCNQETIISIFTKDPEAILLAKAIWWKVCVFNFEIALFAMLVGVATGLGKQWALGSVNFLFLFVLGLPTTYYLAVVQNGGLEMAWTTVLFPYMAINMVLIGMFCTTDWYQVQQKIQSKEDAVIGEEEYIDQEAQLGAMDETQVLLGSPLMTYGSHGPR